jgi:protein-S-isoprenylcysteine O-methyltransferase Ste14
LGFAAGFLSLVTRIVAALSVGRLRPCFNVLIPLRDAALAVLALSGSLQTWAMIVNPFFSPVIRLQTECSHRVIESGPYKFMRHPGYFAMLISIPASALALGSWLALIPALGFVLVVSRRARLEDEFLMRNLSGYGPMLGKSVVGCSQPQRSGGYLVRRVSPQESLEFRKAGPKHGYRI